MKKDKKILNIALKNARNGAIADILFWVDNYDKGKCTLDTTIKEILLALKIIGNEEESVREYEEKANDFIKEQIAHSLQ